MNMNSTIMMLLSRAPHALQDLHENYGFDFESEYEAITLNAPLTENKARKAVNPKDEQGAFVLLLKPRWSKEFRVAPCSYGAVGCLKGHRFVDFLEFVWQCDFDRARKLNDTVGVAIFQKEEFLKPHGSPYNIEDSLDANVRYKISGKPRKNSYGNDCYYESIYIKEAEESKRYWAREHYFVGGTRPSPKKISDFIDKSGYIVFYRREEWKKKAAELREKRKREAFIAKGVDHSKEIGEKFEKLKADISAEVLKANTGADFRRLEKAVKGELISCASAITNYKRALSRGFASTEAEERESKYVLDQIAKISEALENK